MTHLTTNPLLKRVVKTITSKLKVEMIYLLSIKGAHNDYNIFSAKIPPLSSMQECLILVLTSRKEYRAQLVLQDIIKDNCSSYASVSAIIVPIEQYKAWITSSHLLAVTVSLHKNILLYDSGKIILPLPALENMESSRENNKKEYNYMLQKATDCILGTQGFVQHGQYTLATFLLHQTTELALLAALKFKTGYRANTHNLEKLFKYVAIFCGDSFLVFDGNKEDEKQLFSLFSKVYINARYDMDFVVTENEYHALKEKVQQLLFEVKRLRIQQTARSIV